MVVTGLDGRRWAVRRRWAPKIMRDLRWRWNPFDGLRRTGDAADVLSVFDEVAPSIAVVLLFVALLAFVVTGLPVLIDLFALIVFGVGGALARLVFRRPWTVEATSEDRRVERKVVGWRASGDEVRALARDIQHGQVR